MSTSRYPILLTLFISLFIAWIGCPRIAAADTAPAAPATVWCVGESQKVFPADAPQTQNLVWNAAAKTVTLGSARNEYVAFQIAVKAGATPLQKISVTSADLVGPAAGDTVAKISVANIDLFVEHYLDVKVSSRIDGNNLMKGCTPGEHPTQMVPFNAKKFGAPFEIAAGRNQPVWVDIYVPDNQRPGDYTAVFQVTADGKPIAVVNVKLTVWNFTLPHETHFHSFLYTGPEQLRWGFHTGGDWQSEKFLAIEDQFFQMAHQHRLNFNPSAGDVVSEMDTRYRKYFDGSAFKDRVGKGVGQNVAPMTAEGDDKETIQQNAKRIVDFCAKNKIAAKVFTYVWDEPHSDEDYATSKQRCKWIHEAGGDKLKTFIATPGWKHYDAGDVNIFTETAIPDIATVNKRGDEVWAVNGGYGAGPYVDSPGFGGRSIVWMQWKMDLHGYQFWDCCYWVDVQNRKHRERGRWTRDMTPAQINNDPDKFLTKLWEDPLNFDEARKQGYPVGDAIRINGDGLLYYPGYDVGIMGPIAGYQLKSFRRGAQDYEYLYLLKTKGGHEKEIQAIVDSVCPQPGEWNDKPEAWDQARLNLAALLSK